MIFIQACEADADKTGHQDQPDPPDPVYIQRKGYSDGKQKILSHMSGLPNVIVNGSGLLGKGVFIFMGIQDLVLCLHKLVADLIA